MARCSFRLDFVLRHLPRLGRAPPVTIVQFFAPSCLYIASQFRRGRQNSLDSLVLQQRQNWKVSRTGPNERLWGRVCELAGHEAGDQHGERGCRRTNRKIRIRWRFDRLVRRTQFRNVLRIERAERCRDSGSDADDAVFQARPKQCDPKIAPEKYFGPAYRSRAARMLQAIFLYFFERRCCIVAASTGRTTVFVHLGVTTRACTVVDVIFCTACEYRSDFDLYHDPPCS